MTNNLEFVQDHRSHLESKWMLAGNLKILRCSAGDMGEYLWNDGEYHRKLIQSIPWKLSCCLFF